MLLNLACWIRARPEPEVQDVEGSRQAHGQLAYTGPRKHATRAPTGLILFAQAFEIALRNQRQLLQGKGSGFRMIDDLLQRSGDQHAAHSGVLGGHACNLVEHRERAADFLPRGAIGFNGAGEVLAEAAIEEVVVAADVEAGFGEEVGKILLEILVDVLKTGPRFA